MNKKKLMIAVPIAALAIVTGVSFASAHGWFGGFGTMNNATPQEIASRQTQMFEQQADLLGASVDEVKNAWASGKTLRELAQDKGITDEQLQAKMKGQRQIQMKAHLQSLVTQGVITQAQADQRSAWMTTQMENGKFGHRMGRGFGHHMGSGL